MKNTLFILLVAAIAIIFSSCTKESTTSFKKETTDGNYITKVEKILNSDNVVILYDSTVTDASTDSYIVHRTHNQID